jgi:hypothetical protein
MNRFWKQMSSIWKPLKVWQWFPYGIRMGNNYGLFVVVWDAWPVMAWVEATGAASLEIKVPACLGLVAQYHDCLLRLAKILGCAIEAWEGVA